MLFDLGVSSLQLDEPDRGFAYSRDVPLDMRMDPTSGPTAAEVLNTYPAADLARVLRDYGEERFARRIAERGRTGARRHAVHDQRAARRPASARRSRRPQQAGGHPAKRTFQALRIEVNGEIAVLERALPAAVDALAVGGRVVVLSYHSLEDRLVKQTLGALVAAGRARAVSRWCRPDTSPCSGL